MEQINIIQGDSSPIFKLKLTDWEIIDQNWICTLFVVDKLNCSSEFIVRQIDKDADHKYFITHLLPNETDSLDPGYYILGFQLENPVLQFRREIHYKLKITKQGLV